LLGQKVLEEEGFSDSKDDVAESDRQDWPGGSKQGTTFAGAVAVGGSAGATAIQILPSLFPPPPAYTHTPRPTPPVTPHPPHHPHPLTGT
jgi:hypothetical protein